MADTRSTLRRDMAIDKSQLFIDISGLHLNKAELLIRLGHPSQARPSIVCAVLALCEAAGLDDVGVAAVRKILNGDDDGRGYDEAVKRGDVVEVGS